jgi:hypothetical protein
MKTSVLLAGIAALSLAGGSAAMAAKSAPVMHEMTIRMPGGGIAHIDYTGNVAPKVTIGSAPFATLMPQVAFMPQIAFGPGFVDFARIQAAMDRQMQQMNAVMQQADALAARSFANAPIAISAGKLPAGSQSFQMISTSAGNNFCARSIQITTAANGKENVVRHSAGNCGSSHGAAADHAAVDNKAI